MSEISIKPLGARVLVKIVAAEQKTASGIIIPDSAQEKPQKAIVMAVGNGTEKEKMEVKKGETVLYSKYTGTQITEQGVDYLILNQSDILATI